MVKVRKCFGCKKYRSEGKNLFDADCDKIVWFCSDCVGDIIPSSNPLEKILRGKNIKIR